MATLGARAEITCPFARRCIPAGGPARPWKDKALPAVPPNRQRGASAPSVDQVILAQALGTQSFPQALICEAQELPAQFCHWALPGS
ncbi:MAG: hypothetical protein AMXMBFR64_27950 [Myxococcales bacterium]